METLFFKLLCRTPANFRRADDQADALAAAANHAKEIKEATYQVNITELVESSSKLI